MTYARWTRHPRDRKGPAPRRETEVARLAGSGACSRASRRARSTATAPASPWPTAATGRRCCCSTATRRRARAGTAWRPPWRAGSRSSRPTCAGTATATGPRGGRSRRLLQARDGRRHGGRHARPRAPALRRGRPRPGRARGPPHGPRPPGRGGARRRARHRAHAARSSPATDQAFATAYYHWFFLIQPDGLPETMIGRDPEWFLRETVRRWSGRAEPVAEEAIARVRALLPRPGRDPRLVRGLPGGGRHRPGPRRRGRRRPHRVPAAGAVGRARGDAPPLRRAGDLAGRSPPTCAAAPLPCGHFLPEEAPGRDRRPRSRGSSPPA